ncbi:SGNH/GDSL hydrolase family protein [Methylobacterium sp. E-066]|uniref:SGNH/GDSL hydrolase family protein n=1 Tax=Methylobacterium sp. E-066 TaxID=2836584 RepID=UPI001FBA8E1B|nr:SGNH/GDSL hydrolase family protein [Methylobacterium sp. E-066]MCJ2140371.1 SGNH/GDSL hydrolase family protein [Methylobacterium sp. E-066]
MSSSASMLRVLCLGYSVTELPGYVERANALAEAEGRPVTFLRSGWGGHSLPTIACLIDEILDAIPCDHVLLELFTGNVRYFDGATMRAYLDDILAATARRNLPVAFLNLHQGGVAYGAEPVAALLAEYRTLYSIPYLDIAAPVAAGDSGYFLTDGTHVAPAGAELYGTLVYAFLRAPPPGRTYIDRFRRLPVRFESLPLRTLPGLDCGFTLRRNGIPLHFLEIPEGASVEIPFGRPRHVIGALVTYGPQAGTLTIRDPARGRARAITAYDEFSYYTRSVYRSAVFPTARSLTITQEASLPDIALRKGEPDRGPRLGRVSHVFFRRRLGLAEHAALIRHRLLRNLRRLTGFPRA